MPAQQGRELDKLLREDLKLHNGSPAAFGSVRFASTKRMPSKWAAFSSDSSAADVCELLTRIWTLPQPPVLISITGAAKELTEMRPKDKLIFRRGLREAARKTGAWILTGGTNSGVMKMVGNMVQEQDDMHPVCIAVAPMGCVHKYEEMLERSDGRIFRYDDFSPSDLSKRAALDPNHSHILLVDNGKEGDWGAEIDMRAAIEDAICKTPEDDVEGDDNMPTPMVLVVVGGGPGTLKTIVKTLEKERPVVVYADSGGAATAIYKYIKNDGEMPTLSDKLDKNGEPENKAAVRQFSEWLPRIRELGENKENANRESLLSFFKPNSSQDGDGDDNNELDVTILEAILTDCNSVSDAIMHAVRWSQPNVIDAQLQRTKDVNSEGLVKAFTSSLLMGTSDPNAERVVKTLIDYNADVRLVDFNKLFRVNAGSLSAPDPFGIIQRQRDEQVEDKKAAAKRKTGGRMMGRSRVTSLPSMMNLSKYQVHGFQLLEEELAFVGYDKHLESRKALSARKALKSKVIGSFGAKKSRSPGGDLVPTWLDLMMWAVLIGEDRLARLLWRKTDEPMRAAIMGARVANKIAAELGPDHLKYEELKKQAQQYEQWAIDVLDEIKEDDMAIALLTVVPKKHVTDESGKSGGKTLLMWKDSVMDLACAGDDPCRAFVARSNCQMLLTKFFNGDYSSSKVKIDTKTSTISLIIYFMRCIAMLATFGFISPFWPSSVDARLVTGYAASSAAEDELDDDDNDDDEFDDVHFSQGSTKVVEVSSGVSGQLVNDFQIALGLWNIPRVKFLFHSALYLAYCVLYVFIICGSDIIASPWQWAWTEGYMLPNLPTQASPQVVMELLLWAYLLGRIIEESTQVFVEGSIWGYISDGWNRLDLYSIVIMLVCLGLRIIVWIDVASKENYYNGALALGPAGQMGLYGLSFETKQILMQCIQICFSLSSVIVFIRFFDTLSIFPRIGEIVIILEAMIKEAFSIYIVLVWSAIGVATGLSALLPQGNLATEFFLRPFWYTMRAILGDFDIGEVYEILGDSHTPNQNIMTYFAVALLYSYVFISTITIVNLMIAQMTQSYERISSNSTLFRKYSQVDLIREYKDKRGPLPPPLNVLLYVWYIIRGCLLGGLCRTSDSEENEEGFSDFMWMSRAEKLFKAEREIRDGMTSASMDEEGLHERVKELSEEQDGMRTEMQRSFETIAGRFDNVAEMIRKMQKQLGGGGGGAAAVSKDDGIALGRPSYVAPRSIAQVNYVQDAASVHGPALSAYPPTASRPRYMPLQGGAVGMQGYGGASGAGGRPGLAAVRDSQHYLSSVAQVPMSAHRSAPRLGGGGARSGLGSQAYDVQLMDSARRVFVMYDRNSSGDIDARELQAALRDLGLLDVDSAQTNAILARYDTNSDARLDFVEFTQLLHELREFQTAAARAEAAPARVGGGYYTSEQIRALQDVAARQGLIEERARLDGTGRLASLDAGPPPTRD